MVIPRRALWAVGFLVFLLGIPLPVPAAKLVGVVSERSAPVAMAGAHRFLDRHDGHEVVLRTPAQLAERTDKEVAGLWADADGVFLAGVFGDAASRLRRLLDRAPPPEGAPVLAVSSTRSLVRASRFAGERPLADLSGEDLEVISADPGADEDPLEFMEAMAAEHPEQADWLRGRAYWRGRGADNAAQMMAWLLSRGGADVAAEPPRPAAPLRYYQNGEVVASDGLDLPEDGPAVAVLAYDDGNQAGKRRLLNALCQAVQERGPACFAVLARWGDASRQAVERLGETTAPADLGAIISLQDFVIGGGEGRDAVTSALKELDVPVLKGVRLPDRTRQEWRLSAEGLPVDSVHYRVSMPELQGVSQPMVVAAAGSPRTDPRTGLRFAPSRPLSEEVQSLATRTTNWVELRTKDNADKRLALIYYNHPPGRHNIGADNLDVPESVFRILQALKDAGYRTGALPDSPEALLERMQKEGVNLPENRAELERMSDAVRTLDPQRYRRWLQALPETARAEMWRGPLGYLHQTLQRAMEAGKPELGRELLERMHGDLRHLLQGVQDPAAGRALDLLEQLRTKYRELLEGEGDWQQAKRLAEGIRQTGIEGLRGWGEPPGRVMVHDGEILLPGMRFGNIWIGPQPPRGWEVNEELLHANLAFPPPHQYLAYYFWLRKEFGAEALVHLGRHSTYEFLPRKRVGLGPTDYPRAIAGDLPGVYPYIVDGVGEGLQAKRRGLAVIVDHLTPPLSTTPLYDELLKLRQLVESYESASGQGRTPAKQRALEDIRAKVEELELRQEIEKGLREDLGDPSLTLDSVDGGLLVHEVGHYLTTLQEEFMPRGLHIFGEPWTAEERDMMLESMAGDGEIQSAWRRDLKVSPGREMEGLLSGLDGEFIAPAKGNDPIRTPEVLPTGRNFHGLNGNLLPTRVGWEMGAQMAANAREKGRGKPQGSEAVVLWASDTVRDEGAMVAFGLDMLGVKPVWNSRGIVEGLERQPLEGDRFRRDVVFTTSGLFRDLYGQLQTWLDKAVRLALDGASQTIRERHPELAPALESALQPLGELRHAGTESLERNRVAAHWVAEVRRAVEEGEDPAKAGKNAIFRVYGDAPGGYGAGVNRLAERSGAWQERGELADTYLHRMGHAYGAEVRGREAHGGFRANLERVQRTYLGRASNLYGLLDNNDAFDYLGGLSMAVEQVSGSAPDNRIIDHSDPKSPTMQPLRTALLQELRGQFLNPAWLKGQMAHGYSGARTMGGKFMEFLWGWQVTNPQIIQDWVWREVKSVYLDDKHDLGLDEFLAKGHRAHVRTNMLAIMNVAIQKGFWEAKPATAKELARQFARSVAEHGLPGSGHTRPDHPVFDFIKPKLSDELRAALDQRLEGVRREEPEEEDAQVTSVAKVTKAKDKGKPSKPQAGNQQSPESKTRQAPPEDPGPESGKRQASSSQGKESNRGEPRIPWLFWGLGVAGVLLVAGGFWFGLRGGVSHVRG